VSIINTTKDPIKRGNSQVIPPILEGVVSIRGDASGSTGGGGAGGGMGGGIGGGVGLESESDIFKFFLNQIQ